MSLVFKLHLVMMFGVDRCLVLISLILFEKWATLKAFDDNLAITIAQLFLRNRQPNNTIGASIYRLRISTCLKNKIY